jgi:hypothetical protein
MAPQVGSQMKCGLCGLTGHNRRTCRQNPVNQLNPVVCCSPEYSGITLCDDLFEMIGSQVKIVREKEIVDYWEDLNMQSKSLGGDCGPNAWAWLAMDRGLRKFYGFSETCFNRKRIIEIIDIARRVHKNHAICEWGSWMTRVPDFGVCGAGVAISELTHSEQPLGQGRRRTAWIPETPPPIVWIHNENRDLHH